MGFGACFLGFKECMFNPLDVKENRVYAAIGYFGFLCFVPLIFRPKSRFAHFHGKQGLVLFIAEAAVFIISFVPIIGKYIWFILLIIFAVLAIQGYLKALAGKKWPMPYLGKYAERIRL
jgi:uncharacterized membrane protein